MRAGAEPPPVDAVLTPCWSCAARRARAAGRLLQGRPSPGSSDGLYFEENDVWRCGAPGSVVASAVLLMPGASVLMRITCRATRHRAAPARCSHGLPAGRFAGPPGGPRFTSVGHRGQVRCCTAATAPTPACTAVQRRIDGGIRAVPAPATAASSGPADEYEDPLSLPSMTRHSLD